MVRGRKERGREGGREGGPAPCMQVHARYEITGGQWCISPKRPTKISSRTNLNIYPTEHDKMANQISSILHSDMYQGVIHVVGQLFGFFVCLVFFVIMIHIHSTSSCSNPFVSPCVSPPTLPRHSPGRQEVQAGRRRRRRRRRGSSIVVEP